MIVVRHAWRCAALVLVLAVSQHGALATGDDDAGTSTAADAIQPLGSSYTLSALVQRDPPAPQFRAGRVRWSCLQRECQGVADERFDGCKMIRSCFELRRLIGTDNGIVAYVAAGHSLEASRLQLCNHPETQAAQSLIPQNQLPPDPNCPAGGSTPLRGR